MEDNKLKQQGIINSGSDRRTFLKKGAVASVPLVLSAFSRPVLALDRCGLSGNLSGNLSGHEDDLCEGGYTHGGWKTVEAGDPDWGSTDYEPGVVDSAIIDQKVKKLSDFHKLAGDGGGTTFAAALGSSAEYGSVATLLDIMTLGGQIGLGCHWAAAILNASYTKIDYYFSVADVRTLYSDYLSNDYDNLYGLGFTDFEDLLLSSFSY